MLQKLGHTWYKSFYTNFRKDFTEILHKECIATAVPQVGARVQIATDIEAACAPLARCDAAIAQVGLPLGLIPSKRRDRAAIATVLRLRTFCRRSWGTIRAAEAEQVQGGARIREPSHLRGDDGPQVGARVQIATMARWGHLHETRLYARLH